MKCESNLPSIILEHLLLDCIIISLSFSLLFQHQIDEYIGSYGVLFEDLQVNYHTNLLNITSNPLLQPKITISFIYLKKREIARNYSITFAALFASSHSVCSIFGVFCLLCLLCLFFGCNFVNSGAVVGLVTNYSINK